MTVREAYYLCTYRTPEGEGRAWMRAWSADEALASLRDELAREGMNHLKEVRVAKSTAPPVGSEPSRG